MAKKRERMTTGAGQLDKLLGGLYIGDNVVWHDDAGSLANVFCTNFIGTSLAQGKPLIYVSFDRSPKNLLDKLGELSAHPRFTLLDCFTHGKGAGSSVFLKFYEAGAESLPCRVVQVADPRETDQVMNAFYGIQEGSATDVRFVFESLTGMQELWGGEENLLNFYSHSCPRLYELNTIAYWIIEKGAHSQRLKARINQIAQVAVDLSVKRGNTLLTILKAESRPPQNLNQPQYYWCKERPDGGYDVSFDPHRRSIGAVDLGQRIKELRSRRGISQTELARRVGVTPSNVSQVESNLIYPSLPALMKMAEILSVEVSAFFQRSEETGHPVVFPDRQAVDVNLPDLPRGAAISAKRLTPIHIETRAEPFIIEVPPKSRLNAHFFSHKGEEMGYLMSGKLELKVGRASQTVESGGLIYLTSEMPTGWYNPGPDSARLLWVKIRP